jgi:thiamine pyrophosphate-dependent acetolactate synthase large subunit-like protein
MSGATRMSLVQALQTLHSVRRAEDVVISAMGAARDWMTLGTHPLDLVFVPSSMGQATSLGLGLALARPDRRVIVLSGDGGTLMNLGSLITITACAPGNLIILVFDNGVYEVTGAQPTPAAPAGRSGRDRIGFSGLARASGFPSVFRFGSNADWADRIEQTLASPGPVFAVLEVAPMVGAAGPRSPGPAPERARQFMVALQGSHPSRK